MQNERPKKIDCPVPGCLVQLVDRKRILQHMRRHPHNINLNHNTIGPQGGNESLRRQKHTKRYARWLEAQGLPIDVTFFTNVDDELKSVEGWEEVHLSEDDEPARQSTQGGEDEDEGVASSVEDELPPTRLLREHRRRYKLHDGEEDEEDGGLPVSGSNIDHATNQNENGQDRVEPTDEEESSWRPAGWTGDDEECARSLILLSQAPVHFSK
ncbi:hypothetical protein LTR86_007103 [Recurvomyces mirabilis]|nr:hypothetical protein LTR86_007103 [Recurvomyces mirabilis]